MQTIQGREESHYWEEGGESTVEAKRSFMEFSLLRKTFLQCLVFGGRRDPNYHKPSGKEQKRKLRRVQ